MPPDDPRPARVLAEHQARAETRTGLRARSRVNLDGVGQSYFARELLLLERPARMRVEVLGLMGQRVALMATDGAEYDVFRAETGRLESGAVHSDILRQVAGIPLSPAEAVVLLLGVPRLAGAEAAAAADLGDGALSLRWSDAAGVEHESDFDAEGRLLGYRASRSGESLLSVGWSDYQLVGSQDFAHRVELEFPGRSLTAKVQFQQVELDPEVPAHLFRLRAGRLSSQPGEAK